MISSFGVRYALNELLDGVELSKWTGSEYMLFYFKESVAIFENHQRNHL